MISYKIVEEKEVNGLIYQKVRFYDGAITTEDEETVNGVEPVTRYRRTELLDEQEYWYE